METQPERNRRHARENRSDRRFNKILLVCVAAIVLLSAALLALAVSSADIAHSWWWVQYIHPGRLTPAGPHNPQGGSYWFWSGIGSDLGELTIIVGLITILRHRNCHVNGCWRLGHASPEHGFPVCSRHSRHSASLGVPHEKLDALPPLS